MPKQPNFPLFESPRAHALLLSGDIATAARWLGYARAQLQGLLARHSAATTITLKPVPGVTIQVFTKPNRILIFAGGLAFIIHGFLHTATGATQTDSEFVVYKGDQPSVFLNPILLTPSNTLALSTKFMNGTTEEPRKTFSRYNKMADGSYVFFPGPADPYAKINNRVAHYDQTPMGYILYSGLLYTYSDANLLWDVRVLGDKIYTAQSSTNAGKTAGDISISTFTVGNKTAQTSRFNVAFIKNAGSDDGFTISVERFVTADGQTYSYLPKSILNSDIGTPAGALSKLGNATLIPHDVRFDLDTATVSVMMVVTRSWSMDSGLGTVYNSTTAADISSTYGGSCIFYSSFDLVFSLDKTAEPVAFVAQLDPFTAVSVDNPITYRFYPNQSVCIKATTTPVITSHTSWADSYPTMSYFSNIKLEFNYVHPGHVIYDSAIGCAANGRGDPFDFLGTPLADRNGDMAWVLSIFNSCVDIAYQTGNPGSSPVTITWVGSPTVTWGDPTLGISLAVDDPYAAVGIISQDWQYVVPSCDPSSGTTRTGTATAKITREAKLPQYLEMYETTQYVGSGTYKSGYSFDVDTKSSTYKSRRLVDIGLKSPTTPYGPITVTTKNSIKSADWSGVYSTNLIAGLSNNIPEAQAAGIDLDCTNTIEVIGSGAEFAIGAYIGDTLIGRLSAWMRFQTGLKATNQRKRRINSSGFVEVYDVSNYFESTSYLTNPIPPIPVSGQALNGSSVASYFSGMLDYDRGLSAHVYPGDQFTELRKGLAPTPATWGLDAVAWSQSRKVGFGMKAAIMNGGEHVYEYAIEGATAWADPSITPSTSLVSGVNAYTGTVGSDPTVDGRSYLIPPDVEHTAYVFKKVLIDGLSPAFYPRVLTWTTPLNTTVRYKYLSAQLSQESVNAATFEVDTGATDILGAAVNEYVVVAPLYGFFATDPTNLPTKYADLHRADVAVLNMNGVKIAESLIFPNGTNPNDNVNANFQKVTTIGVTGV